MKRSLRVEVVYALPSEQVVLALEVEDGTTIGQVIERSGIARFPEISSAPALAGVFGKRTPLDAPVCDGDRIELYRPLTADPKDVRRAKAKLRKARMSPRAGR
jgi:putative ubiquitin-RnfH superfamily antitoxin RatB of RatAB toxin-antitoxin module